MKNKHNKKNPEPNKKQKKVECYKTLIVVVQVPFFPPVFAYLHFPYFYVQHVLMS
jgi:hypothetical protein